MGSSKRKSVPPPGPSPPSRRPFAPSAVPRREVSRELEALRLPAAQARHRLAEGEVAEPDRGEGAKPPHDLGRAGEAHDGLVHGEVEHPRDGEAVRGDLHLQHVRPVAPPVAIRAAQVHVAQELHLEMLEAVARAGGAASVRVVEAEPAGGIAAFAGERLGGEELADGVEGPDVARGTERLVLPIGDWSTSTTSAIASAPSIPSWRPGVSRGRPRRLRRPRWHTSSTRVDLPEPLTPVTHTRLPSGIRTSIPLQVVLCRAADEEVAGGGAAAGAGLRAPVRSEPPARAPEERPGATDFREAGAFGGIGGWSGPRRSGPGSGAAVFRPPAPLRSGVHPGADRRGKRR